MNMKKIQKFGIALGSVAAIAAPIATVISCGDDGGDGGAAAETPSKNITLALDGHDHTEQDQSFNQQGKEGIDTFLNDVKEVTQTAPVITKPASPSGETEFKQMYANIQKGSTVVAPGFLHIAPLGSATEEIQGKTFILVDGTVKKANIASIEYKVEQAAYLAGYSLALYAAGNDGFAALKAANNTQADDANKVSISTFGGLDIPTVTGFMGGFQQGIEAGIAKAGTETTKYPHYNKVEFKKLANKKAHFSGGFAVGGGATLSTNMKTAGVDVLLPVAGPQTQDALSNFAGKVIGVDTAQEKLYTSNNNSDRFLFSILKNIKLSVSNMLKKLNGDSTIDAAYKGLGQTTYGDLDNNLVGISSKTADITTIYNAAKADSTVLAAAKAATTVFTV